MEKRIKTKLIEKKKWLVFLAFFLVSIMVGISFGQSKATEECKDKEKEKAPKIATSPNPAASNSVWVIAPRPAIPAPAPPEQRNDVSEKSIAVHPKVYVSLCVSSGKVKVNGWDRDEIRAFVDGGSEVSFKIRETKGEEKTPIWIDVLGYEGRSVVRTVRTKSLEPLNTFNELLEIGPGCLSGDTIELDLPKNASLKIKGSTKETTVDSLRWVEVNNTDGSIYVSSVSSGVNAQTFRGNVTVKKSGGKMELGTIDGDVIAYQTESNEIGDFLNVKTQGGSVTLQSVGQRDVKVNSVSGSINVVGDLANYGRYNFNTGYGAINLAIPNGTSCAVDAQYGGYFKSEIPIEDVKKGQFENVKSVSGRIGGGSCNLIFRTFNGSIIIKRLTEVPVIANFSGPSSNFLTNFEYKAQ